MQLVACKPRPAKELLTYIRALDTTDFRRRTEVELRPGRLRSPARAGSGARVGEIEPSFTMLLDVDEVAPLDHRRVATYRKQTTREVVRKNQGARGSTLQLYGIEAE